VAPTVLDGVGVVGKGVAERAASNLETISLILPM